MVGPLPSQGQAPLDHDGVDGPLTASVCQSWVVNNQRTGAIHEQG